MAFSNRGCERNYENHSNWKTMIFLSEKKSGSTSNQVEPISASSPSIHIGHARRGRKRFVIIAFILIFIAFFYFLSPLDLLLNWIFVYETPFHNADAVLVGGIGGNLDMAIELYHQDKIKEILITSGVPQAYKDVEAPVSMLYFIKKKLDEADVPFEDIYFVPRKATNMLDRQLMIRDWIKNHNCHSYIMFTRRYNSRMKKIMHDDAFPDKDVELILYPSDGKSVWRKQWLGMHNTMIRMMYWKLVYRSEIQ